MSSKIILGHNQYGKAEVRVVKITRDTDRHEIEDLNVTSQLRGDFAAAHLEGDNATLWPRTRRRTPSTPLPATASARRRHSSCGWASTSRPASTGSPAAAGKPSPTAGTGSRPTARSTTTPSCATARKSAPPCWSATARQRTSSPGLKDLTVLKSTQSGFVGYPKDKYTTLPGNHGPHPGHGRFRTLALQCQHRLQRP